MIEINATTTDIDVNDPTKFYNVRKLKLQQFLRADLRTKYEQKMFLKLVRESGYEAAEAFRSSDKDDKTVDANMKKKLDEIRKQSPNKYERYMGY